MRWIASLLFAMLAAAIVDSALGLTGWPAVVVGFLVGWMAYDIFPPRSQDARKGVE